MALSYLESKPEDADRNDLTIAFIPGWSMPASIWREQLAALGREYRAVAFDPRGQGESEVPPTGYTAERRATDLRDFLARFPRVLLIAWSLGAIESLQYVHMFGSGRLAGMVLVDSSVGEAPAPPSGGTFQQRLKDDRNRMLEEFLRALFAGPRSDAEIDELARGAKRMRLEDSLALLSYPFERAHWKRIVYAFDQPLLYVVTPQLEAQAHNLRKHRPGVQVEVFRDAGHALFVDQPQRFDRLIEDFARKLSQK